MKWFRHRTKAAGPSLPPEPPVGSLVQEVYGNGDLWRRTQASWQMFNRYDGSWMPTGRDGTTWARLHECGLHLVTVDITAPSKPSKEAP